MKRRKLLSWAGSLGTLLAAPPQVAQDDRSTITIFVGAASSMDFAARAIADHLLRADIQLTSLRKTLLLCYELELLSAGQYHHVSAMVQEVGRLLGGWRKRR